MAVRLDIRPRLVLRDEPVAKARPSLRLPPLTFPAVGYWLAMGALTYFFAHLGESPLETAFASTEPEPAPAASPAFEPTPAPTFEPAPRPLASPVPLPEADASLALAAPAEEEDREAASRGESGDERLAGRDRDRDRDRGRDRDRESAPTTPEPPPVLPPAEPPRVAMRFPEFTDTSRPATRERAASGPSIDSDIFGEGPASRERPEPGHDASRAPETDTSRPSAALSCEAAVARNREEINIGGARGPADVTRDAYAGILENGRYLSGCSIPDRTLFEVCAAVRNGRAVGVTVSSNPPSAALNSCVRRAVSRLKFPANPRLDVTHTRFDAARR